MKLYTLVILAVAATLPLSCSRTKIVQPLVGAVVIDTLLGDSVAGFRIETRFATILNAGDSPALEAIEQANIGYFFAQEDFSGSAREAARVLVQEIADDDLPDLADVPYEFSADSEITLCDTLLTFAVHRWSYLGGAHGTYGTEYFTYSLADGYEYALADLFDEPRLKRLDEAIRARIREQYQAGDDAALAERGFFPEYIAATENFRITPEGMTFFYNPYEIGCYALGAVEVRFSNEEIELLRR